MTEGMTKNLLKKISEAQNLGKMLKMKFSRSMSRGSVTQVAFEADFEKSKGTQLMLVGETASGKFKVQQFQFALGR